MQVKRFYIVLICVAYARAATLLIDCTADFFVSSTLNGPVASYSDSYELQIITSQLGGGRGLCMGFNISTIPQQAIINSATLYYRCQIEYQGNGGALYPGACQIGTDFSSNANYDKNTLENIQQCIPEPGATTFVNCSDPSPPVDMTEALRQSISNGYDQFKICTAYYGDGTVLIYSHNKQSNNAYIVVDYSINTTPAPSTMSPPIISTTAPATSTSAPTTTPIASAPTATIITTSAPSSSAPMPSGVNLSGEDNSRLANSAGSLFSTLCIMLSLTIAHLIINVFYFSRSVLSFSQLHERISFY